VRVEARPWQSAVHPASALARSPVPFPVIDVVAAYLPRSSQAMNVVDFGVAPVIIAATTCHYPGVVQNPGDVVG